MSWGKVSIAHNSARNWDSGQILNIYASVSYCYWVSNSHLSDISNNILSSCDSKELTQCCWFKPTGASCFCKEIPVSRPSFGLIFGKKKSKIKMYMHAVYNHLCWKSPIPPMAVHGCLLTSKPRPEIIIYPYFHILRFTPEFHFLLCLAIRQ